MDESVVLNKRTNRFVKVGTPRYLRLLREGAVDPPTPACEPEAPAEPPVAPVSPAAAAAQPAPNDLLKDSIIEKTTEIVRENKEQFADLTQGETDKLLRRMLYEKLCGDGGKKNAKKNAKKKKKKKRVKFKSRKVAEEESSSEDSGSE
jgi:hypothetical protein